ncbi:MAG: HEAT repeat domain-containing protein [Myxococcota bacterium]
MSSEDDVFEDLEAENAETRRRAVRTSESLPPQPRRQALVVGLGDADWRVRREAIDAVVTSVQGDPSMVHDLVDAILQGENIGLRNAALEALGQLGPLATTTLKDRLRSLVGGERKFVLEALGNSQAQDAVAAIVPLCDDEDANVSAAAIDALARIGGPDADHALRERLSIDDPFQRMATLDGLVRMGARLTWEELAPVLVDRFALRASIPLLGWSGSPKAVQPLAEILDRGSSHLTAQAVVALADLADSIDEEDLAAALSPARQEAIRTQIHDGDRQTRVAACGLALVAQDETATSAVIAASASDGLSPLAVRALRRWGIAAADPLLRVAGQTLGASQALALELAAELGRDADNGERFRAALLAGLQSTSTAVVRSALEGLRWHAKGEDTDALLARLVDESTRDSAFRALTSLAERAPDVVRTRTKEASIDEVGPALPRLLAKLHGDAALESLRAGLAAVDPEVRRACLHALSDLGGSRAADLVTLALTDEAPTVRAAAAQALGLMGTGTEALSHALPAESAPEVRIAIIEALAHSGDPQSAESVAGRLSDSEPPVVVAALIALEAFPQTDLSPHVRRALRHHDPEVIVHALGLIQNLDASEAQSLLDAMFLHPSWRVRAQAARSLADVGVDADATLRGRLEVEEDPTVREAIARVLDDLAKAR